MKLMKYLIKNLNEDIIIRHLVGEEENLLSEI